MGAATVKLLARRGAAAVAVGDYNEQNFEAIKEEVKQINGTTEVTTTKIDVAESASVKAWIEETVKAFGRLDGCANVAGVPQKVGVRKSPTILEETDETWRRTMAVNIDGIMYSTREEVRAMVALPKEKRCIVNVSSMASVMHGPDTYAYTASKTACVSFSSSVAKDVMPFGIRVNTVSPGATMTPMLAQFFADNETATHATAAVGLNMLQPEDIARSIVYLLCEDSDQVMGVNLIVGSGAP